MAIGLLKINNFQTRGFAVVPFASSDDFAAQLRAAPAPDAASREAAAERNGQLTKPPGALGRLEDVAIWFATWSGAAKPELRAPQIAIFAGNHGVTAQGVSAFPAEVTAQMVYNFEAGGAAINQLAKVAGATLDVIALDLDKPTKDFSQTDAMSEAEVVAALAAGWNAVRADADLLVVGEMGIGNTTSAAAIAALICGGSAQDWVGRGTGVDDDGLARKQSVVDAALARHDANAGPMDILRRVGGREIAAMAGAMASARVKGIPVILDGFIASSAALVLHAVNPGALDHAVAGHVSAEGAHGQILDKIGKSPLLDLGLRLGEGSGAALAIQIVAAAVACHSGMATFAEAGVSDA